MRGPVLSLGLALVLASALAQARPVRIQLFGDSTQWGYDGRTEQPVAQPPAAVLREVAAQQHAPVADVDAWMRTQFRWQAMLSDGVHPTQAGYREIVLKVLMPTLEPLVVRALQAGTPR